MGSYGQPWQATRQPGSLDPKRQSCHHISPLQKTDTGQAMMETPDLLGILSFMELCRGIVLLSSLEFRTQECQLAIATPDTSCVLSGQLCLFLGPYHYMGHLSDEGKHAPPSMAASHLSRRGVLSWFGNPVCYKQPVLLTLEPSFQTQS